jgi:hypothetical protein
MELAVEIGKKYCRNNNIMVAFFAVRKYNI